jgi:hypothetical protein
MCNEWQAESTGFMFYFILYFHFFGEKELFQTSACKSRRTMAVKPAEKNNK